MPIRLGVVRSLQSVEASGGSCLGPGGGGSRSVKIKVVSLGAG